MAKIDKVIVQWFLHRRIKQLESKILFEKDYHPLFLEDKKEQLQKKCQQANQSMQASLIQPMIEAGVTSEDIASLLAHRLQKVRTRYYWKNRALQQWYSRHKEELAQYQVRRSKLHQALLAAETKVRSHFEPSNDLVAANAAYEALQTKKRKVYEEACERHRTKIDLKIKQAIKRHESILSKLEPRLQKFEEKLFQLDTSNSQLEAALPEGVVLKLDKLSMHFGGLKAVDQLSFEVKRGEIFGLIGPNGAGKTTVFNCITRFYKQTSGNVYFRNRYMEPLNLSKLKVHDVIKEGIVRTFQNVELIWELNVIENLLVSVHTQYRSSFFGQLFNSSRLRKEEQIMRQKAMKILADLELSHYAYWYPLGLPYGILKKVELARTLMVNPDLIILDEPAAGLNDIETIALQKTIRKIRDEYNATIFLVEHDMGLVMEVCDTVCAISFGKLLAIGTPKQIQQSPVVREAYLGGEA